MYGYGIGLAVLQHICDINLESQISVVCSSYLITVEIYISHVHDAFEVE